MLTSLFYLKIRIFKKEWRERLIYFGVVINFIRDIYWAKYFNNLIFHFKF